VFRDGLPVSLSVASGCRIAGAVIISVRIKEASRRGLVHGKRTIAWLDGDVNGELSAVSGQLSAREEVNSSQFTVKASLFAKAFAVREGLRPSLLAKVSHRASSFFGL
jgi:hypothetical protein